ncbi:hypothetical protein [Roseateles sp. BYS87W]|uniref:Uncharacterized protein n=1 Tax=Pelomonas baiyunensis TaxID=3299026 RepID=A0ABW7H4V7_9BURK
MQARTPRIHVGQLPHGRFMPHGELQVWPQAGQLCYAAAGPFNVEMVTAMSRAVGRLLQDWRPTPPYLTLTWWHGSLLASPEVLQAYRGLLRLGRQVMPAELASLWLVGPEIDDAAFMKPRWLEVHEDCGYRLEFCSTEAEMLQRAEALLHAADGAGAGAGSGPQPEAAQA